MRRVIAIAVMSIVAGCADPKAATETNFRVALQHYLNTAYPRCYYTENFPVTRNMHVGDRHAILDSLTKVGLLSAKEVSRKELAGEYFTGGKTRTLVQMTYDLTDEGRKFYTPNAEKNPFGGSKGGFCFGKATVKAVTQFTEPADLLGQKVSRVQYTYVVSDLPPWAKIPEVQSSLTALKGDAESDTTPVKAVAALILTNKGWVHEKLFAP
jgi:hypothetical protein